MNNNPLTGNVDPLMIGFSWYPEMWPEEEWAKDVARMCEVGLRLVRVFEFAWHRCEPQEGDYDFAWAHRVLDQLHAAGLRAMIGTPTAAPPAWLTSHYPEVLQTRPDGSLASHGQRKHYSHHSAKYRELSAGIVTRFAAEFSAYSRLPRQITYEGPTNPKLWGKLQPPAADAPDLVKLIHWGADVIVTQNTTHELLKSQLAYFLYAWPVLKDYLPAQNYEVVRDFAFSKWADPVADHKYPYDESAEHDLLSLKTKIGGTKGAYPPGFSVQPNLLMHEVAEREGRADADLYLIAAVRQADWLIANLDWNEPLTTKGQRMSEFITVTGLAQLLADYPARAPKGLAKKLNDWAAVVIRRSDNLWDFRKLGDASDQWTPMGDKPTMRNEPGNVVGLPAAIFAAQPFITDASASARLEQIAWAHFDAMFGRNPTGRHFSYDAPREIEGVEFGWYHFHVGGIGRLENARFVIDGSPKNQHFPFHPEVGNVGWTEGWVQHNTPFNLSLAYLARSESSLTLTREGDSLLIRLRAPLDFDYDRVESATVTLVSASGDRESITVTEESASSRFFSVRINLRHDAARPGDGALQAGAGGTVTATYGFGYLGQTARLRL